MVASSGLTQWRDSEKPKAVLERFCLQNGVPVPEYPGNQSLLIGTKTFTLAEFGMDNFTFWH